MVVVALRWTILRSRRFGMSEAASLNLSTHSYAKGEVGELKSQLYRCADNNYITTELFDELYKKADILTKKITAFISYLNASKLKGQKFKNRG